MGSYSLQQEDLRKLNECKLLSEEKKKSCLIVPVGLINF